VFLFLTFLMVLVPARSPAQGGHGAISGRVTDSTHNVLQGAKIKLTPSDFTAVTDEQGAYRVSDLLPGEYSVEISFVGFTAFTKTVAVVGGQTTNLDAELKVEGTTQSVVVTSDLGHGEAEEVNRERTADNILQVLTSDVINSLPNATIADVAGRLPSVSLERDEGEGKYIQIRSLEPRLTNATIDGVNVPSPEPNVREVKFDAMPADLVESVEVNKTLQANMDGDGIGGSVNIVTKTAGERPTLSFSTLEGVSPIFHQRLVNQDSGTIGKRFGQDHRFGILFGGSYDWNGRGINDIEPVPDVATLSNGTTERWFDTQDIREYQYKRSRWGLTASADYKLGEGSNIYIRGIYSSFHDFGDKWVYTLTDNTPGISLLNSNGCSTSGGVQTCGAGVPAFSESNRVPIFNIGSIVLGGKHNFTKGWLAWDASISRSEMLKSGGNEGADFQVNSTYNTLYPNGSTCQFSPALTTRIYIPQWSPSCFTEAYAPTNYQLEDITTSFGKSPQLNLQASAAYARRYHIGSHLATVEVGGKFRNEHKFDDSYTPEWLPNGSIPMTDFIGPFVNNNYYSGLYKFGPTTNWGKDINFLNANPGDFGLNLSTIGPQVQNFDYVEKVSAGYVMNTIDFSRFRFVAGVRFEGTNLDTFTPSFGPPPNPSAPPTAPGSVPAYLGSPELEGSYLKVLPSASVRIDLGNDTDLRLVYSRALSRPDPQDIAQALSVTLGQTPMLVSLGNPNLKAETANNYDVLAEHYLHAFGMIQGGFFYKQLYNPIVQQSELRDGYTPVADDPTLYPVGTWSVSQPINAGSGWLTGVEFAYLEHFTSLPGLLGGLGLSANYSWTNSRAIDLPGRADSPRLLRQAPNVYNISPTFDHGRLSLRVGITYNSASIYSYQFQDGTGGSTPTPGGIAGPDADTYMYGHFQLDAQGSVYLKYGFTVYAYGLNLNNEVFGFYNGQPQYMIQREYYGPTIAVGMRWSPRHEK
jgi:TonB-dependent receptor